MKQKTQSSRSLKRLVMMRPVVMVWRFPAWVLATPWGLWLAVFGNIHVQCYPEEMLYCLDKWFGVLLRPAFWLGYANDAEYRKAKHHNGEVSDGLRKHKTTNQ